MMAWGYFFGILKAHFVYSFGHFIFDMATLGFYAALLVKPPTQVEWARSSRIRPWVIVLIAWPVFMAIIPLQHYLVQIIGLRGNIFWIPMLLVGAWLDKNAIIRLAITLAGLNIVSFGFAMAEFVYGVETFVPENEVTAIVYRSRDLAGQNLRIPSTFANAHTFALTMVASIPILIGVITNRFSSWIVKPLLVAGMIVALAGVFLAGPKSPVVNLGMMVFLALFSGRINLTALLVMVLGFTVVGYFVAQEERMQRFMDLQNLEAVTERIQMSANLGFFEVMADYPMGKGMGAGGTSLPYWAEQYLTDRFYLENEFARLLLEQGLPGLMIWICFIFWAFRGRIDRNDDFQLTKTLLWFRVATIWATAWIGIGMMTTIPGTAITFLAMGFIIAPSLAKKEETYFNLNYWPRNKSSPNLPAYQRGLARA
jgi:hypothetical protein